jgi:peptidoglycan hydrolase CwlO-like protein
MFKPDVHLPTSIPVKQPNFKMRGIFLFTLLAVILATYTFADDPCKNISDLDDKAKCYEEQIEKKENEYQSTSSKLSQIRETKNQITQKISGLLSQISVTQGEIDDLQNEITKIKKQLEEINAILADRKTSLAEKISLRNKVVRTYSKRHLLNDIETFLVTNASTGLNGFQFATLSQAFNTAVTDETIKIITGLNSEIDSYEKDKAEGEKLKGELEDTQKEFLAAKAELDARKNSAQGELSEVSGDEKEVAGELNEIEEDLAELTSKQQAVLQAKSGDFSASLSEGVETDDSRTSPNYNPGFSPAFAAFSYGAYTHRNGMSQYGARGRAEEGQDFEEILDFYYNTGTEKKDGLDNKSICVEGVGDMKMGEYLKGLGEMPPSWHEEALKAQVIAARTYAYNKTKNGGCICTSTNCQYFSKDLVNRSDRSRWYDAIKSDDAKDRILEGGVSAQYSSTTGGWINGRGWDVDGSWPNDAYEKKGGSPWFYKAWFTQTYKKTSSTCGRKHPWLDGEEMADILNAYVLLKAGKNPSRVLPETINDCPIAGMSGDPYDKDELRDKAESVDSNAGYENVTGVKDIKYNDGRTTTLTFITDKGEKQVDGQLFAEAFNIRAPGYTAIKHTPDSKALFNILKK